MKQRGLLGLALLLAVGVTAGVAESQRKKLAPLPLVEVAAVTRADGSVVADSFRITARWQAVQQANGQLVPSYLYRFLRADTVACHFCTDTTTTLERSQTFAFPAPGDSARYHVEVAARDTRGLVSPYGRSIAIVVRGEAWAPPPPPVVTIDTLRTALEQYDSLSVWAYFKDGTKLYGHDMNPLYLVLGDSIQGDAQLCAWGWKNGVKEVVEGQPLVCSWGGVGMGEFGTYLGQRQT